jgi:putative tryptophan/tyrosine transport system substrate-binding protein
VNRRTFIAGPTGPSRTGRRGYRVNRRTFIAGIGSTAAWPISGHAQLRERMPTIGILMAFKENNAEAIAMLSRLLNSLETFGWVDGRTVRVEIRWTAGNPELMNAFAKELIELNPGLLLAGGNLTTAALQRLTKTIPIVFVNLSDPVGDGFTDSLAHPGGNITGFANQQASLASKWLELLTQIAPGIKRVAMLFGPHTSPGGGAFYMGPFEFAARSVNIRPIAAPVRSDDEIEAVVASLGSERASGFVVMTDIFVMVHSTAIVSAAARYKVPGVYWASSYVREGGLLSYGVDYRDSYSQAAPYIDRILRGARPAELPVQLPVKFEMALNRRTAKALGLEIQPRIVALADEIIE